MKGSPSDAGKPETAVPEGLARRAREHIEEHYRDPLDLSSVCRALRTSPGHLSRAFRRETGITLTEYIQHVRLRAARRLLCDRTLSLSEVAYRVGYRSYRHFYRNVVRWERASPRDLRRRLQRLAAGAGLDGNRAGA